MYKVRENTRGTRARCTFPSLSLSFVSFALFYFAAASFHRFFLFCPVLQVLQKGSQRRNVKVHFTWEQLNSNGLLHRFVGNEH